MSELRERWLTVPNWVVALGAAFLLMGAFGRRRNSHLPFEFEKYRPEDVAFAVIGAVAVVFGAVWLFRRRHFVAGVESIRLPAFFERAGMPRTIYELLLGIAAVDGHIDGDERKVVAQVMTQRLPDIVTPQDLKNWASTVEPPRDPVQLARHLAPMMTEHHRTALWEWCREVAAVDGTDEDEHDVLRRIRAVLKPIDVTTWRRHGG